MQLPWKRSERRGFTLIELLIVVAIIGILAAIAIPNFLEAQIRAKVARATAELRELKMALMEYNLDNNAYPSSPYLASPCGPDASVYFTLRPLTTPVEYMSRMIYDDPFGTGIVKVCGGLQLKQHYQYLNFSTFNPNPTLNRDFTAGTSWQYFFIVSRGPSNDWGGFFPPSNRSYDPTNGTVSYGVIWSSDTGIYGE